MKWAVVTLTALGLAAALCAAILVVALQKNSVRQSSTVPAGSATVLVSTEDLPAMSVVRAQDVSSQTMTTDNAPAQYFSNSAQVVGHILALPMVSGQAFSPQTLVSPGAGPDLAAAIPYGRRAVSISITNYAALQGLLYPGCHVDVMLTFTPSASAGAASASLISATVLEDVEVLAIDNNTVNTPPPTPEAKASESQVGNPRITLLLDTKQAQMLHLAANAGVLSLALRNPLDNQETNSQIVTLSQLTQPDYIPPALPNPFPNSGAASGNSVQQWNVQIIRGDQTNVQSFPASDTQPSQ
jgi:pilus assembly protein CpaB